jgi:hypothetical protein
VKFQRIQGATFAIAGAILALAACGGGAKGEKPTTPGGSKDPTKWPSNDQSMCVMNRTDVEVSEIAGAGSIRPNVRRVYALVGDAEHLKRQLICREVDTNLDGIKDTVRFYDGAEQPQKEWSDRDYDGKIDSWITFVDGAMVELDEDTNKDGKPDFWKFYVGSVLNRSKRDTNYDGNADIWEIYTASGRLERSGVDDNFDGHVDRWDRDLAVIAAQEDAAKKAQDAMEAAKNSAAADAGAPPTDGGAPASDAGTAGTK